jgi:hypothetical protein
MRPAGEIRTVLLGAVRELARPDQAPTLADLCAHTRVGEQAARHTLSNLTRAGHLRIVRTRRVAYRNRPVAEYAPVEACAAQGAGDVDLGQVLAATWR